MKSANKSVLRELFRKILSLYNWHTLTMLKVRSVCEFHFYMQGNWNTLEYVFLCFTTYLYTPKRWSRSHCCNAIGLLKKASIQLINYCLWWWLTVAVSLLYVKLTSLLFEGPPTLSQCEVLRFTAFTESWWGQYSTMPENKHVFYAQEINYSKLCQWSWQHPKCHLMLYSWLSLICN